MLSWQETEKLEEKAQTKGSEAIARDSLKLRTVVFGELQALTEEEKAKIQRRGQAGERPESHL